MKKINQTTKSSDVFNFIREWTSIIHLAVLAILYFFIRSGWQETIEFGFDHAKIAELINYVIETGSFADTAQILLDHNIVGGLVSWGPFMVYMFAPLFMLTKDPLVITNIIIVLNFTGIVFTYLSVLMIARRRAAFFAALFMVAFPWSVILSRMLYNPTPLLCFVPAVIYVTLLIAKKGKQKLLFVLPALWMMMIQFHFSSLIVVPVSFLFLFNARKKVNWKYFGIGLAFGLIPLAPIIVSELRNNFSITLNILSGGGEGTTAVIDFARLPGTVVRVFSRTFSNHLVDSWDNYLGYATGDFFTRLPGMYGMFHAVYVLIFYASLVFYSVRIVIRRHPDEIATFLWFLGIPVLLVFLNIGHADNPVESISQRYMIPSFFPLAIMIASMLDRFVALCGRLPGWIKKRFGSHDDAIESKTKAIRKRPIRVPSLFMYAASFVFLVFFFGFTITYYEFIITYDYPERGHLGWLSYDSSPPYLSTCKALSTAIAIAASEGSAHPTISTRIEYPSAFRLENYMEYIWRHVFKRDMIYNESDPFSFIIAGPSPTYLYSGMMTRIGVWRIFKGKPPLTQDGFFSVLSTRPFNILSSGPRLAIELYRNNTSSGTFLVEGEYLGTLNQQFVLMEGGRPGYHKIYSLSSGRFLDVDSDGILVVNENSDMETQLWRIEFTGNMVRFVNKDGGRAIMSRDDPNREDFRILVDRPDGSDRERWIIVY